MIDFFSEASPFFLIGLGLIGLFLIYVRRGGSVNHSTPTLDGYALDLTREACLGKIDPVVGRDDEIVRVTQVLARRTKNNVILLGSPGVGKTAIVEGLAHRITIGEVPNVLRDKRVLLLQVSELLAGTKYRGDFEQRIKRILQEIQHSERTIILFIDEIHTVTQTKGTEGAISLSDILKPALARGDLQMIGATTQKEYETYILPDESWERRFQIVLVDEPTVDESVKILNGLKKNYEQFHRVLIPDEIIPTVVRLSEEYIKGRRLPDKAIDVMDEAAAKINVERGAIHENAAGLLHGAAKRAAETSDDLAVLDISHVKEVVAEWTGMKVGDIH